MREPSAHVLQDVVVPPRKLAQVILIVIGVAATLSAGIRYTVTRDAPAPTPSREIAVVPASGPVGTHPRITLHGYPASRQMRVLLCRPGSTEECAELTTADGGATVIGRAI